MPTLKTPLIDRLVKKYEDEIGGRITTKKAITWFRNHIRKNIRNVRLPQISSDRKSFKARPRLGDMVFFEYSNPKYKKTLPYYDAFPLALIIDETPEHFIGLNFHYLKPSHRQILFESLLKFKNEQRYRNNTRIMAQWSQIKSLATSNLAEHAIHMYIKNRVGSKFIKVEPKAWGITLFLPMSRFKKASKQKVWNDV